VAELDKIGIFHAELVTEGTLSPPREIVRQFITLKVSRRNLRYHPGVKLPVCESLLEKGFFLQCLFDPKVLIGKFFLGNRNPQLCGDYLFLKLRKFICCQVELQPPVLLPSLVSRQRGLGLPLKGRLFRFESV